MLGKRAPVTPEDLVAMLDEAERTSGDEAGAGLRANMVVTIEPGIYFSRPYLESVFLCDPKHARFIDRDVLEGYYAIGGVRIEDDILVTADGYENLTTAPKGAELLEIINRGRSGSSS
ncbi:hypothetical protein HIM_07258 [Hirsutella minnesotensis 3608]|uniref:Xaa-Pro aminopeptidase n=1 Tax=Hirsutella minnesotensis 3608 TaxID=1043627 RepID=A0A0F8A4F0_9HYPO|nr:hypothetical protein HIM_07258 [Hirsutella minnesotensis 3608]